MIEGFMYKTIIHLWKNGHSKKAIAKSTGHDIKTIRKIITGYETSGVTSASFNKQPFAILTDYEPRILELLEQNLSNLRIYEEIQKIGYEGSYSSVTNFTRSLRIADKVCVRFHTQPGEEAQVDFGEVGRLITPGGQLRKAYAFNMRLSYSRLDYYEIVFDQKVETFIKCHINAFKYFKGVPQRVKIDNLKSAIISASFYEPIYQNQYANLASYYDFEIMPCRVRKPQEKGKVESGIKYIQNNFFACRSFASFDILQKELRNWLDNYCNSRIHGTTKERPIDLFNEKELKALKLLPNYDFAISLVTMRKVHSDCHITVDNNYYSVPAIYVGKSVEVEISSEFIKIYFDNNRVALHTRLTSKGEFSTVLAHYPKYKYFTNDSEEYLSSCEKSMELIGEYTKRLFALIVKENPNSWYRSVRGILSLSKSYSNEVLELACKRALYFNVTSYNKIKSICESGYYNLSLPDDIDSKEVYYEYA
jgi:transposase